MNMSRRFTFPAATLRRRGSDSRAPRVRALLVGAAMVCSGPALSGCGFLGGSADPAISTSTVATQLDQATTPVDPAEPIDLAIPIIPPVAIPETSLLSDTGDLVAGRLGDLVSPVDGLELLTASCEDDSGELTYSGSTNGSDLFDIATDGSGTYREERPNGFVQLDVAADGSGTFTDSNGSNLVTIEVKPDGSGVYYNQAPKGLVAVEITADGVGTYYDDRDNSEITTRVVAGGSGIYTHTDDRRHLTIKAEPDGSGELYWQRHTDGVTVTVRTSPDGSWLYTHGTESHLLEVTVNPDGSGFYDLSGLTTDRFGFDPDGAGIDPDLGRTINLPPTPVFTVVDDLPELGRLGSLSPPCATVLRFDTNLLFGFAESTLTPEAETLLDEVVGVLNEIGSQLATRTASPATPGANALQIVGHTDSVGTDEANLALSIARAEAVQVALVERGLTSRTSVVGKGETQPVAPNENPDGTDDPAGRSLNRRVEIVIPEP